MKPTPLIVALALAITSVLTSAAEPPKVTVSNLRRVFHNNEHNAFTDLVRFRDHIYLTFRSCPDGHDVNSTASVIVIRSKDEGKSWEQVHRFSVPLRDTRDPHFLVFKERLFIYTGTWWSGTGNLPREKRDMNEHLGYAIVSDDGAKWSEPIMLEGTYGHYIWRAAAHGDKAYLCGRRKTNFNTGAQGEGSGIQSAMLESDDGLIWKKRALFTENGGNETAFLFERDGAVLAVDRHSSKHSLLIRSKPPYTEWSRQPLERFIGGPLLVKWGEHYLVGGRHSTKDRGPKTTLYWLVGDKLQEFTEFPSAGDNSYPGFVELSPTRALISYYSSHEKHEDGKPFTAIYLAELNIEK
jgi:hypothetical protein